MSVESRPRCIDLVVLAAPAGERDQHNIRTPGFIPDARRDLIAVQLWHADVEKRGIGVERLRGRDSSTAVAVDALVPKEFQHVRKDVGAVACHQHALLADVFTLQLRATRP